MKRTKGGQGKQKWVAENKTKQTNKRGDKNRRKGSDGSEAKRNGEGWRVKEDNGEGDESAKREGRCDLLVLFWVYGGWELAAPGHRTTNGKYSLNVFCSWNWVRYFRTFVLVSKSLHSLPQQLMCTWSETCTMHIIVIITIMRSCIITSSHSSSSPSWAFSIGCLQINVLPKFQWLKGRSN